MKRAMILTALMLATAGGLSALRADGDMDSIPVPRPAADLVTDLDAIIQTRFQIVRDEDVKKGRLGVSRIIDFRSPHGMTFKPENREEEKAVDKLRTAGWRSALYVGGAGRLGNLRGEVTGPIFAHESTFPIPEDRAPFRDLAKRAIAEKAVVKTHIDDLILEARPVLASAASCLNCHQGKIEGDALGSVVYVFRRGCPEVARTEAK